MKALANIAPTPNAVMLKRSLFWSRAVLWTILITAVFVILWACFGKMDQVIAATGKLEPRGSVYEVEAPEGGVLSEMLVREGDHVKKGDVLAKLDAELTEARLGSLESMKETLKRENGVYDYLLSGTLKPNPNVGNEARSLADYRARLTAESNLLRAQMSMSSENIELTERYKRLFEATEKDRTERINLAELKHQSSELELTAIENQLGEAQKLRANSQEILDAYTKLVNANAGSRLEHLVRQGDVIRDVARIKNLTDREASLRVDIQQAAEERRNIDTAYVKDAMTRLSENEKAISELDSTMAKAKLSNDQRIAEIEGQIASLRSSLTHQIIVAPSDGTVFDLQSSKPGDVVTTGGVLLRIVPSGELIANIDITNRDIGFVSEGMQADVRLESFPFREFGEIPGILYFLGSDVLEPEQATPYYRFPAKVSLSSQTIRVGGRDIPLQSGMAVSVNIHLRRRTVMSLFTDSLLGPLDRMREVR